MVCYGLSVGGEGADKAGFAAWGLLVLEDGWFGVVVLELVHDDVVVQLGAYSLGLL